MRIAVGPKGHGLALLATTETTIEEGSLAGEKVIVARERHTNKPVIVFRGRYASFSSTMEHYIARCAEAIVQAEKTEGKARR